MSQEQEENAAELQICEEFLNTKCLMNCEVSLILDRKFQQLNGEANEVLEKSMEYVKRFSRYRKPEAVNKVCETLSSYRLAEFELGVMGNLCPESVEEAFTMIPSLKTGGRGIDDDAVQKILYALSMIKQFE